MTIQAELENLVKMYSKYDQEKKHYTTRLQKEDLLKLDKDFNRLINKILLTDGPEKGAIEKYYKKLTLLFHPDRKFLFSPEVSWLESVLSSDGNDSICFKTLNYCYEKLTDPQKFKKNQFKDIKTESDLKHWLESLKEGASTYTIRSLYDSLIGLLEQSSGYFNEVGRIKAHGLRKIITLIPILLSSYGAVIFSQELFVIYSLYFLTLKSGQYIHAKESLELKKIGQTLQDVALITATTTTTLLVRMLELTFWASRQCYSSSLELSTAFFKPLLSSSPVNQQSQSEQYDKQGIGSDIVLASQNLDEGIQFNTPEIKLIAASLESYLALNKEQYFSYFRSGWEKRKAIEACIFNLQVIDRGEQTTEEKLIEAKNEVFKLKENQSVYSSKTALAVDNAEKAIDFLSPNLENNKQLVLYHY